MEMSRPAPVLKWDMGDSLWELDQNGLMCGPRALGSALDLSLKEVRERAKVFGVRVYKWMNPTMIESFLRANGTRYVLRKGMRIKELCRGINRMQFEGPWLDPGVPAAEAYKHTHWLTQKDGWVFDSNVSGHTWTAVDEWWRINLRETEKRPWHITHHYCIL